MESRTRQTARDLTAQVLQDALHHQFYQLVERVHRINADNLEQVLDTQPSRELIRYEANPSLAFPKSDVSQAGIEERHADSRGQCYIQVAFMGMHGSASPLPHHYLEQIAYEAHQQTGIRAPFFDFFNHRLITLLHRAWRKYRYYIRFSPEAKDRFSHDVFSLVGLNDADLRGDTPIPWSRLLTYAGMVVTRSRAPSMVAGIVAHCFDLDQVEVKQWEQRYIEVPDVQMNRLGSRNTRLAEDFVIGKRVLNIGSKFVVSIRGLDQDRFRDFLPQGSSHAPLNRLIEFLLRDQLAYDLELGLIEKEIPLFRLHQKEGAHLGWTAFLGKTELAHESIVRIGVRR